MAIWHTCTYMVIWHTCTYMVIWHTCTYMVIWHTCTYMVIWHTRIYMAIWHTCIYMVIPTWVTWCKCMYMVIWWAINMHVMSISGMMQGELSWSNRQLMDSGNPQLVKQSCHQWKLFSVHALSAAKFYCKLEGFFREQEDSCRKVGGFFQRWERPHLYTHTFPRISAIAAVKQKNSINFKGVYRIFLYTKHYNLCSMHSPSWHLPELSGTVLQLCRCSIVAWLVHERSSEVMRKHKWFGWH